METAGTGPLGLFPALWSTPTRHRWSSTPPNQSVMPDTIAIIGGGIIGVSSAYFLAHHSELPAGTRIVIVEGSDIAAGASGKAGGLLALDW